MLFFSLLGAFALASLWLGSRASKGLKTGNDYFLMGRNLGIASLVMTLLATQIGGGTLLGSAEEAYRYGWQVIFYPLGMALGLICMALGFGARVRRLEITTLAEVFEKVYRSPALRKGASMLSIVSLFIILVGQGIAARKFFVSLGFETTWLYCAFWLVLVAYTVLGGLKAVVRTDMLQALFIIVAFGLVFFTVSSATPAATPLPVETGAPRATWLLMPLLFMLIGQDMGQRCSAARRPGIVSLGALIAAVIFMLVCLCPIYLGILARQQGLQIPEGASVLITAVKGLTSPTVSTILVVAILMAIVSTADSLLCSISSNLASDFRQQSVKQGQILTFFVGMSALALSFLFDNVVTMLVFSYELTCAILFVPLTMGVLMKGPKKQAALVSMLCGAGGLLFLPAWGAVLLSLGGFGAAHLAYRERALA